MPKVSVIIPAYNVGSFIEKSLQSILDQTYKNLEVIVCDDGSEDDTWEYIMKVAAEDNRVIPLRNSKNLKAAATRNKCLAKARGKYVAIQDADDISVKSRIKTQLNFLENNPEYDFVGSSMYIVNEKGISNISKRPPKPTKEDFLKGTPFCHGTMMFSRKCLLKINGYYVSKYTARGQDADLLMRLYSFDFKGYNLREPLYYYILFNESFKKRTIKTTFYSLIIRHDNYRKLRLLPKGYIYIMKMLFSAIIESIAKKRL